jgi:hypothetical protein
MSIDTLIARSADLEEELHRLLALQPANDSERLAASRIACSIAFEHAESAKVLIVSAHITSALALIRLQYEALVRAMWLLYAASPSAVTKLTADLTHESEADANSLPMLSKMLEKIEGKAPKTAVDQPVEFKEYSWKPLCSFVHLGIHAVSRQSTGYPMPLILQLLKASNGLSVMVGMLLVILSGDAEQKGRMRTIQQSFSDCLPDYRPGHSQEG